MQVKGTDAATGVPYQYLGPVVMGNTYSTHFGNDEVPLIVTVTGKQIEGSARAMARFESVGWVALSAGMLDFTLQRQMVCMSMCLYISGDEIPEQDYSLFRYAQERGIRVFFGDPVEEVDKIMRSMHDDAVDR